MNKKKISSYKPVLASSILIAEMIAVIFIQLTVIQRNSAEDGINLLTLTASLALAVFMISILVYILINEKKLQKSIRTLNLESNKIKEGRLSEKILAAEKNGNEIDSIIDTMESIRINLNAHQENTRAAAMSFAHEIRTPISIIKGYTEALYDQTFTSQKDIQKALEIIEKKTSEIEEIISFLTDYESLSAGKYSTKLETIKIKDLFKTFSQDFEPAIKIFNRIIIFDNQVNEDSSFLANRELLRRLFEALFTNAIRYTQNKDKITTTASENEDFITLSVSDTGPGISSEHLPKVFNIYYKIDPSREENGIGIGLTIVKEICDFHDWTITVESEINKGTTFYIKIPKIKN